MDYSPGLRGVVAGETEMQFPNTSNPFASTVAIEVEDLGAYYDKMKAIGIQLLDIDWEPLSDEHKYQVLPDGDKIAYFPSDVACGMVIELIERTSKETGILSRLYARSLE